MGRTVLHFECKRCGEIATTTDKRYMTFCSRECSFAYKSERAFKYTCLDCGIKTKGTKYCRTCREANRKEKQLIKKFNAQINVLKNREEMQKIKLANIEKRKLVLKGQAFIIDNEKITDKKITLDRLIQRDKNICYICGKDCDRSDFKYSESGTFIGGAHYPTIDHVLARANGGSDTWDNVKLAHFLCNSLKSDKQIKVINGEQVIYL